MTNTGPISGGGTPAAPQRQGEPSVKVENATGELAHLTRPVRIEGTVIQRNDDGSVRISTAQGDIDVRLRGPDAPAPGQPVEVDLPAGDPPRQAIVRTVADPAQPTPPPATDTPPDIDASAPPPESAALPAPAANTGDDSTVTTTVTTAQKPSPAAAVPVAVEPGDIVRLLPLAAQTEETPAQNLTPAAIVQQTAARAVETLKLLLGLPQPQAGQKSLTPLVRDQTPPPSATGKTTAPSIIHAGQTPRPPATATPAPVLTALTKMLPFEVRITAITPPGKTPPVVKAVIQTAAIPSSPPTQATALEKARAAHAGQPIPVVPKAPVPGGVAINAIVTGHTPENFPVLSLIPPGQVQPARFVLPVKATNLPDGAVVSFIPRAEILSPSDAAAPPFSFLPLPATQWPAFENLKAAAMQASPHIAQSFAQVLPDANVPEQIPAAALFFVAAVRAGDIGGWLGEKALEFLRRAGREDAIGKLSKEMDDAGRLEGAPARDGWRALPLPMQMDGEIQRMMLHYRHDRGAQGDDERGQPRQTRFIFDLSLTKLGPVQIDGLHRPAPKTGRLDLIVRTQSALSPAMQQAMRRAWTGALEQNGHAGELSFQHRPEQFVAVAAQ